MEYLIIMEHKKERCLSLMLDYWFILVGALTDGLFYTLSGGEECRL